MLQRVADFMQALVKRRIRAVTAPPGTPSCPNCGCLDFQEGPCGGMSMNVRCVECGSEWNWTPMLDLFEPIHGTVDRRNAA